MVDNSPSIKVQQSTVGVHDSNEGSLITIRLVALPP